MRWVTRVPVKYGYKLLFFLRPPNFLTLTFIARRLEKVMCMLCMRIHIHAIHHNKDINNDSSNRGSSSRPSALFSLRMNGSLDEKLYNSLKKIVMIYFCWSCCSRVHKIHAYLPGICAIMYKKMEQSNRRINWEGSKQTRIDGLKNGTRDSNVIPPPYQKKHWKWSV